MSSAIRHASLFVFTALLHLTHPATARANPNDPEGPSGAEGGEQPTASPPATEAESRHDDGLFGPIRIGAFAGIGLPRPLSVEGMLKIGDVVGLGLEYSVLPTVSASGVNATFSAIDADLRIFPLRNGFFVGVAAGRQQFAATSTIALPLGLGSLDERVSGESWFVNPRLGFLWTWSWGLTVGIDAGVQIPVATSFTNTIPSELAVSQTATDVAHFFGKDVLPTVDLLRLGLML
jgi:hypothetical protein